MYRYLLSELEKTWQDAGSRTATVATRLLPGQYSFEGTACKGDGRWIHLARPGFYVVPAFYQRTWFLLLLAAACAALLWMAYRLRVRSITRRLHERAEERANERVSIARDLHDTLLQGIHGLMLSFHVAVKHVPAEGRAREELESALIKADRLIVEGRDRVSRLRSESLKDMTLRGALEGFGADLTQGDFPKYEVIVRNDEIVLDCYVSEELFFIAREALTNAFHHAHATSIRVILDFGKREFSMICSDDGCGMDLGKLVARSGHYGLVGMRERSDRLGATFQCTSAPGQGTSIAVRLPCHLAAADGASRSWLARVGLRTPPSPRR